MFQMNMHQIITDHIQQTVIYLFFASTQLYNPYEIEPQLIDDSGSSGRSTTSSPYSNTFTMTQM